MVNGIFVICEWPNFLIIIMMMMMMMMMIMMMIMALLVTSLQSSSSFTNYNNKYLYKVIQLNKMRKTML